MRDMQPDKGDLDWRMTPLQRSQGIVECKWLRCSYCLRCIRCREPVITGVWKGVCRTKVAADQTTPLFPAISFPRGMETRADDEAGLTAERTA